MAHRYPDGAVLYRGLNRSFARIVSGRGAWLYDQSGKDYLDASGGAYAATLGHGVTEIAAAVAEQMGKVAFVSGAAFTNDAVEALAAELVPLGIGDLDKHYFLTSGSDAVEAALKLARQYWVETGRPGKHRIIALEPGYHGNTLLALSASARPHYQRLFGDWLVPVSRIPAPYPFRCGCDGAADCPRCTGRLLEDAILRAGAGTVAAFIGETVGGSSTGASVPRPGYWRTIREICDRHGVLWIADEVLAGSGRTGTWTAVEPYGAVPDLLTLGKGISGGYAPLAAVVAPRRILDPIARGSGAVSHAQTFSHTPVACAAGLAAVRYLKANRLLERCRAMGERLHHRLDGFRSHPLVGDVRGRGMLAGIELVADRRSKAPFPRRTGVAERLTGICREEGLVVWPNTGQVDGTDGDLICLAPPFVLTDDDLGELIARLGRALDRAWETIGPS